MNDAWLAVLTGFLLGFLMQKARVLRFDRQVGALLFRDMSVFKFMLSAILIGGTGLQMLADAHVIRLAYEPLNAGGVLIGGLLFGTGWAVAGYSPGTEWGALAEGRWSAFCVTAGLLAGAMLYAESYPIFKVTVLSWKDFGPLSLPKLLKGTSPWMCLAWLWGGGMVAFVWCEFKHV